MLDDYQDAASSFAEWGSLGDVLVTVFHDHLDHEDALVARLEPFDLVLAMRERTPFPASVLMRLPALRLLVTTGMVNASIDLEAARDAGVVVAGTASHEPPTAELAWALILGLARHVAVEDAALRAGTWQTSVGRDLAGATLGVVGLGRLGTRVARIGAAFEMRVLAWSENLTPERAAAIGARAVTKEELFRRSDVVSIHLRLSERTRGLVGAEQLALMKPTALLVNTSRGPIVDAGALLEALHSESIGGAGLDVFDDEPLPVDDPLRRAPHTLLTPHLGYVTGRTYEIFFRDALEDVRAFIAGSPVRVLNA